MSCAFKKACELGLISLVDHGGEMWPTTKILREAINSNARTECSKQLIEALNFVLRTSKLGAVTEAVVRKALKDHDHYD